MLASRVCWAQTGGISGTISDAQTQQPLPFAHVFVNNTTQVTTTDVEGKFSLQNLPAGQTEVIFTFVGYESTQSKVYVKPGEVVTLTIQLTPSLQQLSDVEVKGTRDKEWEKQLDRFQKTFFGNRARSECIIKNPWVIDFATTDGGRVFNAKASQPIEIDNNLLGYTLFFYLKNFQTDGKSYVINGNAYFKEMEDITKAEAWQKARDAAYYGSERHLFRSMLNQTTAGEGFRLYIDKPGVLDVNSRTDIFYSEVGVKVVEYKAEPGFIQPTVMPNEYVIALKGRTEVHYLKKPGATRLYKDMPGQVSWLEVRGNKVRVNGDGVILNPGDVVFSGDMSSLRIGNLLPQNYQPPSLLEQAGDVAQAQLPVERVYVQTDKPYYYPGETIWIKAYMHFRYCDIPDTLSRVLYVELVNDARKIVISKLLQIDNQVAMGEFYLPPEFQPGNYMIRAYTSWMRNFGDALFYYKPIPVLRLNEKPEPIVRAGILQTEHVVLTTDKEIYNTRDPVRLKAWVQNELGDTLRAQLSIAVTDAKQVIALPETDDIVTAMQNPEVPNPVKTFFEIERGITLKGYFVNKKEKPESVSLMAILGDFDQVFSIRTGEDGRFELKDILLFDSATFAFQAKDKRGVPYGHVRFNAAAPPAVSTWKRYQKVNWTDAGAPQRIFSDYEAARGTIRLEEVTVSGKRIEKESEETQHKIFGRADYVITSEDLMKSGTADLAVAMQGKVPGLTVTTYSDDRGVHYVIRLKAASSFQLSNEPLVLIDGIPVGGGGSEFAGDRLRTLDITTIERVEITTRLNSMYGDAGRNGVIAVFTKLNSAGKMSYAEDKKTMDFYTLRGFSVPQNFKAPVYDTQHADGGPADYRSTVLWLPSLQLNDEAKVGEVTFYAADLPTRYRIVVEGVLETGEPVRAETFVTVVDR